MTLHSVKHDHHTDDNDGNRSAVMIPKLLASYGEEVAGLLRAGLIVSKHFDALKRIEAGLREYGCTPPRPDLSPELRAAWSQAKGEGFWER